MKDTYKFLVILFSLVITCLTIPILLHEYSHSMDFLDIAENGKLLFLKDCKTETTMLKFPIACYSFEHESKYNELVESRRNLSEFKAYSITFLIVIILGAVYYLIGSKWIK